MVIRKHDGQHCPACGQDFPMPHGGIISYSLGIGRGGKEAAWPLPPVNPPTDTRPWVRIEYRLPESLTNEEISTLAIDAFRAMRMAAERRGLL
jgi:hypothetical protein